MTHIRAVIVADGDVDLEALRAVLVAGNGESVLAIGADGGARHLEAAGRLPDLVCGDADSLSAEDLQRFREQGTAVELHPADKDESDTELSVRAALARGATRIVICGALGGARAGARHRQSAVARGSVAGRRGCRDPARPVRRSGGSARRMDRARCEIHGQAADYVSLLPLDDPVTGITTDGLRYPLRDEPLPLGSTRGLSNELTGRARRSRTGHGRLLVIHTPRPHATGDWEERPDDATDATVGRPARRPARRLQLVFRVSGRINGPGRTQRPRPRRR